MKGKQSFTVWNAALCAVLAGVVLGVLAARYIARDSKLFVEYRTGLVCCTAGIADDKEALSYFNPSLRLESTFNHPLVWGAKALPQGWEDLLAVNSTQIPHGLEPRVTGTYYYSRGCYGSISNGFLAEFLYRLDLPSRHILLERRIRNEFRPCSTRVLSKGSALSVFPDSLFSFQDVLEISPRCRYYLVEDNGTGALESGFEPDVLNRSPGAARYFTLVDTAVTDSNKQ